MSGACGATPDERSEAPAELLVMAKDPRLLQQVRMR